jgi:hypothetical protein
LDYRKPGQVVPADVSFEPYVLAHRVTMKTAPENPFEFHFQPEDQDRCSVTVVYEDTDARQRALALSHHLVRAFWAEIDFDFTWWRFRYLDDPNIIEAAAKATAQAHVILFSSSSSQEPSTEIQNWIELWVPRRTPGEGVILVLTAHTDDAELAASPIYSFLQSVAHRAQMDCLPRLNPSHWSSTPQSLEQIQNRARKSTHVLDGILRQGSPPHASTSHWGINE